MPRYVDHDLRRRQILEAAWRILGERGVAGLSFRAVAKELGGSTTLVTHYFSSQAELLREVVGALVGAWEAEIAEAERGIEDPYERLRLLLEQFVPTEPEHLAQERARVALLAERLIDDRATEDFKLWERRACDLLRTHLAGIVAPSQIEERVAGLRVLTNGLTLSALEYPDLWPPKRLLEVLRRSLDEMGLAGPGHRSHLA